MNWFSHDAESAVKKHEEILRNTSSTKRRRRRMPFQNRSRATERTHRLFAMHGRHIGGGFLVVENKNNDE